MDKCEHLRYRLLQPLCSSPRAPQRPGRRHDYHSMTPRTEPSRTGVFSIRGGFHRHRSLRGSRGLLQQILLVHLPCGDQLGFYLASVKCPKDDVQTSFCLEIIPLRNASSEFLKSSIRSCSKRATSDLTSRETWSNSCLASSARRSAYELYVIDCTILRISPRLTSATTANDRLSWSGLSLPWARFVSCCCFTLFTCLSAFCHTWYIRIRELNANWKSVAK